MMRRLLPTVRRIAIVSLCVFVALALAATTGQAAFVITPESGLLVATGNETSQDAIDAILAGPPYNIVFSENELYKADVPKETDDPVIESGPFATSYDTVFDNEPTDPEDATITWVVGSDWVTDPWYLLVKDGKQEPAWYLFDLSGWNGQETLSVTDFWTGQGGISHVTIYGSPGTPIPEPASLAVWSALGVIFGIGLYRRRRGQR